ncbi:hypothetical protein ASG52_07840 [Methylobacterium sp. Leaf456]|uniref:hypothetical protein n=1 Tax=Methylobacterium sp. Leaf456 TaxID=1736382 RepID=UPI0006FDBDC9|nr:hypothetical protein [Methylobacterium sp. Leaf456]KQT49983.1 hypothetical protein ASG52_07840 [Methylobacterium sp. Leaf456]
MLSRLFAALALAAPLLLTPVLSQAAPTAAPAAKDAPKENAKEPSVAQSAARERQKKCGAEWRALTAAEKTAQGPKWPQYYSKCVKRLKEKKA